MFSRRMLAPLAVAAGILAASPSGALAAPDTDAGPQARGGDVVPLIYPGIVDRKLTRTQSMLDDASNATDLGDANEAAAALTAARNNLGKAWKAAKYYIKTTPPPPPVDDRPVAEFHRWAFTKNGKLRSAAPAPVAHRGGAPVGPTIASIYDTGFAVLSLQHQAVSVATDLLPDVNGPVETSVEATIQQAQKDRDKAVKYIHKIDVVTAPPPEDRPQPLHRDGPPVSGWATVMPNNIPYLDDEMAQIKGTLKLNKTTLSPTATSSLQTAQSNSKQTEDTINTYWPPLPADD
jgi:hypothetical protein